jgi:hypothetical protein
MARSRPYPLQFPRRIGPSNSPAPAETINALNHTTDVSSRTFRPIKSAQCERNLQIALKYMF